MHSSRKYGSRSSYIGSTLRIVLHEDAIKVGANTKPESRYMSMDCLLTNRDLPMLIIARGYDDLTLPNSVPAIGASFIRSPSRPKPAFAEGEQAWRFIRQLNINYLALSPSANQSPAQALRAMLSLFINNEDKTAKQQIESIIDARVSPITRRTPSHSELVYGRGIQCRITVDEEGFSGISPYLLGAILEQFIARHVSALTFTELEMESKQRGIIACWPVRMGTRSMV